MYQFNYNTYFLIFQSINQKFFTDFMEKHLFYAKNYHFYAKNALTTSSNYSIIKLPWSTVCMRIRCAFPSFVNITFIW